MDWDILGHEWAARMLATHVARQEVRHAYLFAGQPGVGRRTLALRFAQALNCLQPPAPGQACGRCRICAQTARMAHADLSVLQAETEGGALKVEQVRDLQRMLSLTPYEARWRVALLLRFEEAGAGSQNALLKTLEEPSSRVVLLVTAASPEVLLPTIVSRCEVLRLRPLRVVMLSEILKERYNLSPEEARRLAHLSQGRVGMALRLAEDPRAVNATLERVEDLLRLVRSNRRDRFAYVASLIEKSKRQKDKASIRLVLQAWVGAWRDLLISSAGGEAPLVNLDHQDKLESLASALDLPTIRGALASAENAQGMLDATNVNSQLLLEKMLLDFPYLS